MAAAEVPTQRKLPAPDHAQLAIVPALTPVELLRIAVAQNADIDKLKQLMDMQERWERNEARKAFVVAMNAFKLEPTRIIKNKHVKVTPRDSSKSGAEYNHATLDHVCDAVIGGLSKHGISHRWKVEQEKEWIKVTCVLRHDMGWEEETTLMGTADNTGSKNSIQAVGSTVTYLQRYTLLAATGLAAADTDTDGRPPTINAGIPSDRVNEQCEWLANAKDLDELKRLFRTAYSEADGARNRSAMTTYISAKDRRKRELQ